MEQIPFGVTPRPTDGQCRFPITISGKTVSFSRQTQDRSCKLIRLGCLHLLPMSDMAVLSNRAREQNAVLATAASSRKLRPMDEQWAPYIQDRFSISREPPARSCHFFNYILRKLGFHPELPFSYIVMLIEREVVRSRGSLKTNLGQKPQRSPCKVALRWRAYVLLRTVG